MLLDGRARRGDVAAAAEERRVLGVWAPAVAMSANAWAALLAAFVPTPAGSPVGPAITKSLVKIAFPYWLLYENPFATNWFSSDAA